MGLGGGGITSATEAADAGEQAASGSSVTGRGVVPQAASSADPTTARAAKVARRAVPKVGKRISIFPTRMIP
jgi:hypothetical protein